MSLSIFHRPELAKAMATRILSEKGSSGIFLAALRRTGKSTFIREDLSPILRSQGAEVIYVDLWTDRTQDPGILISRAISEYLQSHESVTKQLVRKGVFGSISLGGIKIDLSKLGVGESNTETLSRAFQALSKETGKPIVMIVDEAQHAQTSDAGSATMFALKAARDELNSSRYSGFRLVATGSNRDKLAILVTGKDQSFLNAKLVDMPHLGDDFLEWSRNRFEGNVKPTMSALKSAFDQCTYRPEVLSDALDALELQPSLNEQTIDEQLKMKVAEISERNRLAFMQIFDNLPILQAAVLQTMSETGHQFAAFRVKTMNRYEEICLEQSKDPIRVDASSVQYALDALREKQLIWRSGRGVYSIEETQHASWLSGVPEDASTNGIAKGLMAKNAIMDAQPTPPNKTGPII